eukprot:gnl/Hemi2/8648_TR2996_c0_g1_i1.p1 gnl/Hemi2/8648_TR2996_c0_g1~~gnl/Hemi2/8648_TR2996_c0_g1_i1.p1  ORF type:complete len:370 (-),score=153.33 gnl/Hemi2/8648_TR2996_c0_g1_i1:45-1010(-)
MQQQQQQQQIQLQQHQLPQFFAGGVAVLNSQLSSPHSPPQHFSPSEFDICEHSSNIRAKRARTDSPASGFSSPSDFAGGEGAAALLYDGCYEGAGAFSTDKEQVKEKRKQRNREHARTSRLRKKEYVDELEDKLVVLEKENAELRVTAHKLTVENGLLKEILGRIIPTGGGGVAVDNTWSQHSHHPHDLILNKATPLPLDYATNAPPLLPWSQTRTTGVLLVVLFSFALFLDPMGLSPVSLTPPSPPPDHPADSHAAVDTTQYAGRVLFSVESGSSAWWWRGAGSSVGLGGLFGLGGLLLLGLLYLLHRRGFFSASAPKTE